MLQLIGWAFLAVVVAGALCALAVLVLPRGEQIAPVLRDEALWSLPPERALLAEDVDSVRLPVALRGYRFAETDQLLDRLAGELRERDAEIARLRGPALPEAGAGAGIGQEAWAGPEAAAETAWQPQHADPAGDA